MRLINLTVTKEREGSPSGTLGSEKQEDFDQPGSDTVQLRTCGSKSGLFDFKLMFLFPHHKTLSSGIQQTCLLPRKGKGREGTSIYRVLAC